MLKTIYNRETTYTYRLNQTNDYNIPVALNTDNILHVSIVELRDNFVVRVVYFRGSKNDVLMFWDDRFEDVVRFFNATADDEERQENGQ